MPVGMLETEHKIDKFFILVYGLMEALFKLMSLNWLID